MEQIVKIIFVVSFAFAYADSDCTNAEWPSKERLEQQYFELFNGPDDDTGFLSPTFNMHPVFQRFLNNKYDTETSVDLKGKPKEMFLYGKRRCRKKSDGNQIMERSTCPWFLIMTVDDKRFPREMASARCKCKHCENREGGKRRDGHYCEEITTKVKVLRYKGLCELDGGTMVHQFGKYYETVAIGCTCVREKIDGKLPHDRSHKGRI